MYKITEAQKYKFLEEMGARPEVFQRRNPGFLKAIMARMRDKPAGNAFNSNNYMFEFGNEALREKLNINKPPKVEEQDVRIKFRRKSGKKNVIKGQRKA